MQYTNKARKKNFPLPTDMMGKELSLFFAKVSIIKVKLFKCHSDCDISLLGVMICH